MIFFFDQEISQNNGNLGHNKSERRPYPPTKIWIQSDFAVISFSRSSLHKYKNDHNLWLAFPGEIQIAVTDTLAPFPTP